MIGSTTPCPAEAGFRPLRAPLAHFHAAPAYPAAPAAIPGIHQRAYPQIKSQPQARRETFAMTLPRSLRARLRALAPDDKELGLFLEDLALSVRAETGNDYDLANRPASQPACRSSRKSQARRRKRICRPSSTTSTGANARQA